MLKTDLRGICLILGSTVLTVGIASAPAQAKGIPDPITQAAAKMKCKGLEPYNADKPAKFAVECHLKGKGKHLGYYEDGRTDMLLYKTKGAGKAFWDDRLGECGGQCYIVQKGKLWIAGGGYEKDIAKYVAKKFGGKVRHY